MKLRFRYLVAATVAALVAGSGFALAGNTTLFSSTLGDLVFPITPPTNGGATPGTLDNTTIGGTTPAAGTFTTLNSSSQVCTSDPCTEQGKTAAQGGAVKSIGGASTTSANAGGSASLVGGAPGATGVGGAAIVVGAAGGATSGAGGAASLTGGVGTAGNSAGGAASVVGGAGQGSAAGGASSMVGGVGGATGAGGAIAVTGGAGGATSGTGGTVAVTGGAGSAGNANGGDLTLAGGAANGSGVAGVLRLNGVTLAQQGAETAQNTAATLTMVQILTGLISTGPAAPINLQLPLATAADTALPTSVANDSFDFSIINTSTTAANIATITTNTGWTLVGGMGVAGITTATSATPSSGHFRIRKTGTGAWTIYRIS